MGWKGKGDNFILYILYCWENDRGEGTTERKPYNIHIEWLHLFFYFILLHSEHPSNVNVQSNRPPVNSPASLIPSHIPSFHFNGFSPPFLVRQKTRRRFGHILWLFISVPRWERLTDWVGSWPIQFGPFLSINLCPMIGHLGKGHFW